MRRKVLAAPNQHRIPPQTRQPNVTPNAVSQARCQPCTAADRSTSAVSKPGVSVRRVMAKRKERISVIGFSGAFQAKNKGRCVKTPWTHPCGLCQRLLALSMRLAHFIGQRFTFMSMRWKLYYAALVHCLNVGVVQLVLILGGCFAW